MTTRRCRPIPDAAFEWQRTGAPQVRHSHAFLARLRNLLRDRAPDVLDALFDAGASEIQFTANLPETLTDRSYAPGRRRARGASRAGAPRSSGCCAGSCSRSRASSSATARPRMRSTRGRARCRLSRGRRPGPTSWSTRGPRSSSADWLAAIGAAPVARGAARERHRVLLPLLPGRRRTRGAAVRRPDRADLGYLKYAIFLGDNRTFSITYAIESHDEELRRALATADGFETVARSLVAIEPWRADGVAEPITDVHVMAGLRNRYRPLVDADGAPLVHGFVAVGDASVCTNPLYGRGCSLAFVHAFGLADALREHGADTDSCARGFAAFTERELVPWFRSAVLQDTEARAMHEELPADDPRAFMQAVFRDGLLPAMRTSPVVFRAFLRWFNLLATPDALMADPEIVAEVLAAYEDRENRPGPPVLGPDRDGMLVELQRAG